MPRITLSNDQVVLYTNDVDLFCIARNIREQDDGSCIADTVITDQGITEVMIDNLLPKNVWDDIASNGSIMPMADAALKFKTFAGG